MTDGSYNGLTIGGAGADVGIVRREGLRGLPRRRNTDLTNPRGGVVAGPDDREAREVMLVLALRADDPTQFAEARQEVLDAFVPGVTLPYNFDNNTKTVFGRVDSLDVPEDFEFGAPQRFAEATVMLHCPDPNVYSSADTLELEEGSGVEVPNAGTVEAPFVVEIPGPCTDPRIRRSDNGTFYCYRFVGLAVPSGTSLIVDLYNETASLTTGLGVWPPTNDAGNPSPPWGIKPGGSTITIATGSGSPTATVTWRDAWAAA